MRLEIRRAIKEDAKSLANIIVESWKSTYGDIIPKEETKNIVTFLINLLN